MAEKRTYLRVKDGATVIYKTMGVMGEYPLHVLDISAGGVRLPLKEKIKAGTLIELQISLPEDKEPFFGLAKIAWQHDAAVKDKTNTLFYETGVQFIRVGVNNRKRILRYVLSQSNPYSTTTP
ncbi:MAG TPA: hypothetical protein DCL49_06920 [Candidatus Omnitrophica bacterium]|nr:hypothetical protein [Candidatus Omnitrophota bacterium]HBG63534.1 hypothetical protein [Candidatus Omnitrophota bacterium]HCD37323.1 hypothetical protein [Candidatus Omnitrophota bacterium]